MARRCSECGGDLSGKPPHAKTCGDGCRQKRSRRLRRQKVDAGKAGALPEHQKVLQEVTRGERDDVAQRIVEDELRPVVREAITDDVLRGISDLIALAPTVVDKIREDLESDDSTVRQKAYSLVAKYTFGHPAIVRPPEEDGGKQLIVHFGLPRPDDGSAPEAIEATATELVVDDIRQCDSCQEDKSVTEFVAGSSRCRECYEEQQRVAREYQESIDSAG